MPTHSIINRLPHDPRSQRGFTLIELMISLVIGLLLSAAIVKIYADTSQIYRFQSAVSEVQENGRFASTFLRRAARLAGNFGCDASKPISGSTLSDAENTRLQFFNGTPPQPTQPVGGTEGGAASDELILRGTTGGGIRLVAPNPAGAAANLTVETESGLANDSFAVISDCNTTHMFKINSVSGDGSTITHTGTTLPYTTENGARVQEIEVVRYCIGPAVAGGDIQALKRLINPGAGETCPNNGVELVEGIHNLQVRYGVDTDATPDNFANRYVTAPGDMSRVKTLRIELLVRSLSNGITSAAVPYTLEGTETTPVAGDRHLYKVMTNTITLRNRGS